MTIPTIDYEDPLVGFQFQVQIDGPVAFDDVYFTEVSGLGSESEIIEEKLNDKQNNPVVKKIPGRLKWQDVTLKRGITSHMGIWDWRKFVEEGKIAEARSNCTITMFSTDGNPVAKWNLFNAWPSKVTGPAPKSDSNEYGIEEMVIVHEGMRRMQ